MAPYLVTGLAHHTHHLSHVGVHPNPVKLLQRSFNVLMELFYRVGMYTNVGKMVSIVCQPYLVTGLAHHTHHLSHVGVHPNPVKQLHQDIERPLELFFPR